MQHLINTYIQKISQQVTTNLLILCCYLLQIVHKSLKIMPVHIVHIWVRECYTFNSLKTKPVHIVHIFLYAWGEGPLVFQFTPAGGTKAKKMCTMCTEHAGPAFKCVREMCTASNQTCIIK